MIHNKKSKIYRRLLKIVIAAIILCTLLCSGAIYFYLKPVIEKSLVEKNRNMIAKMTEEVSNSLEDIMLYAQNITFDETVQDSLDKIENATEGSYNYYSGILTLERKLKEYRLLRDNLILDIFVVDRKGKVLETSYRYEPLMQDTMYQNAMEEWENERFLPAHKVNYYGSYGDKETITYVNNIYDKEKIKTARGRLVILMNLDQVAAPLYFDRDEVCLEFHNQEGDILFGNSEKPLEGNLSKKEYYRDDTGKHGWYLCYQIASKDIANTMQQMNTIVVLIVAVSLLFMITLVIGVVRKIVEPLEILIQGMQRVADGSRKERIDINTGDECEVAANVFNSMVENINHHTEMLLESEKKQYESQMKMLSYQLNPHFIYNTLNAVICLARKQNYEEIIHLTRSFITILRAMLRTDLESVVSIQEEKAFMEQYVKVLQICYHNVPCIQWKIPEELENLEIPRLVLYPLVENSIFHGILPKDGEASLTILFRKLGEWIEVCVEDDGVGCTEEEQKEIQLRLTQGKTGGHYGLYNVNERLKLIYKEVQPLKIQNCIEGGTCISFCFQNIRKV